MIYTYSMFDSVYSRKAFIESLALQILLKCIVIVGNLLRNSLRRYFVNTTIYYVTPYVVTS